MVLSIIVPVYQVEKYLRDCILSILKIKEIPYEIIIIDDGSEDKSINTIQDLIQAHDFITLINQSNQGLSVARNNGFSIATGEYVWFVDSDDIIDPKGIERLVAIKRQEDILIGNYYRLYEDGSTRLNSHKLPDIITVSGRTAYEKYYLKHINTVVWRCVYKREFLIRNNLNFLAGVTYEDVEWSPKTLYAADRVLYTNIPIYFYRVRTNSIVKSQFTIKKFNDIIKVSDSLDAYKLRMNLTPICQSIIDRSTSYFLLLAYRKAKLANITFNEEEIIERIRHKRQKGSKYSMLLKLKSLLPYVFDKVLSLKFDRL